MNPDAESDGPSNEEGEGSAVAALRDALLTIRTRQLVEQHGLTAEDAEQQARATMSERALRILRDESADTNLGPGNSELPGATESTVRPGQRFPGLRLQF
jgi:hypothetical protein